MIEKTASDRSDDPGARREVDRPLFEPNSYLGEIIRLQIQASSLKLGETKPRWYDPGPIREVLSLVLEPSGVRASAGDILDVHHALHPTSKFRGENAVSIGFTSHYARMREYFGEHLMDGAAGENLLVRSNDSVDVSDLENGITIVTADGRQIGLQAIEVAEPCVGFTRFALRFPRDAPSDATVTEALRFLREGMRGFYASYAGPPVLLQVGDRVYKGGDLRG